MSQIQPYRPRAVSRVSRELNRISDAVDVDVAATIAKTEVECSHLDGLQAITGRAMQGVAITTQLEQQLSTAVPLAASRLQAIGDMHALASADVVASAPRRLRCLEAVLVVIAGLAFLALLVWCGYAGNEVSHWRATARRERLLAEVELQRLTHLAVLRMLQAAREHHRP